MDYDIVIIGGGTSGASAAIFTARAGLRTLVVDADKGMTRRALLNNHLGFPKGITGPELVELGREHAIASGAEWREGTVTALAEGTDAVSVTLDDDSVVTAANVLLAIGVTAALALETGIATVPGTEPRIQTNVKVDAEGRTSMPRVWAAGTIAGSSVHTIVTAGDGARVAINIISETKGERHVDHDMLPAPERG